MGSFQTRDENHVSCFSRCTPYTWATTEALYLLLLIALSPWNVFFFFLLLLIFTHSGWLPYIFDNLCESIDLIDCLHAQWCLSLCESMDYSCEAPPSKGFPRHCLILVCGRRFLPKSVCFGFWNSQGVLQHKTTLSFLWRYWLRLGAACWCFKVKCPLQHYSPRNLDSVHPCLSWLPDHTGWKLASLSPQHSSSLLTSTHKRTIWNSRGGNLYSLKTKTVYMKSSRLKTVYFTKQSIQIYLHDVEQSQLWYFVVVAKSLTYVVITLCDPMDCSTPDSSDLHCFLEFAQIHVHWVSDAI